MNNRLFTSLSLTCIFLFILLLGQSLRAGSEDGQQFANAKGSIRINEVMFNPSDGNYEWIELKNVGNNQVDIGGFGITDEDGHWYRIPSSLSPVPEGAFVVVIFDGLGAASDELDFDDDLVTLHTPPGLVNIFDDQADQVALYQQLIFANYFPLITGRSGSVLETENSIFAQPTEDNSIIDFIAWGEPPGNDANNALKGNIWSETDYISLFRGFGFNSPESALAMDESIGLLSYFQSKGSSGWILNLKGEESQGWDNEWPSIEAFYPQDGATLSSNTVGISWVGNGAESYRFQLDDGMDFNSPIVNTELEETFYLASNSIDPGVYYWRVQGRIINNIASDWSKPKKIIIEFVNEANIDDHELLVSEIASKKLNVTKFSQYKDTNMLDLDGSPEDSWDKTLIKDISNQYCARATIKMLNYYYGGNLSMDRISYQIYGGGSAEGDFVRDGFNHDEITNALEWALGTKAENRTVIRLGFNKIKESIDNNQPIIANEVSHSLVITGYKILDIDGKEVKYIYYHDPAIGSHIELEQKFGSLLPYYGSYHIGPKLDDPNLSPQSDEDENNNKNSDLVDDSDDDNLVDFDEIYRFDTDPNNPDSDGDGINDKEDIRGYVFNNSGQYSPRSADIDGDGLRKEKDSDNDDGGTSDGCEDTNRDGKYQSDLGETNNFDASDDAGCPTATPTMTNTPPPTVTNTPSPTPMNTPMPSATPTNTPIPTPTNTPVPENEVTLDIADTEDYFANDTDNFRPGEVIVLKLAATNHTNEDLEVRYSWKVFGPNGTQVDYLSFEDWTVTMPPGEDDWYLTRGISSDAPKGVYRYQAEVEYGGKKSVKQTTFSVQGSSIPMRLLYSVMAEDIKNGNPVGITDDFKQNDDFAYAYSEWEGADGKHEVEWKWYKPNGGLLGNVKLDINESSSYVYLWSWICIKGCGRANGRYEVRTYIDGSLKETQHFDISANSATDGAGSVFVEMSSNSADAGSIDSQLPPMRRADR